MRQTLKKVQGMLHLRVRELDGDAVLRRNLCDHSLPLHAAVTRDSRSEFLDGHLQSEEDGGFILVENGDDASAVDDGNLPVECVGHVAGLAADCPDAGRGDLVGNDVLLLLGSKPLLREVGPIGAADIFRRWPDMQCA